jgi:O-antigen/teichoic acid export membrane protein
MKPKDTLSALTVLWVLVVVFEGISSIIRFWYSRKMNAGTRAVSKFVNSVKAVFMVILAVSNVMLFMRHVEDR